MGGREEEKKMAAREKEGRVVKNKMDDSKGERGRD